MPEELRYSNDHEWVERRGRPGPDRHHRLRAGRARRRRVRPGPRGRRRGAGRARAFSEVESTKSVSDIYAPVRARSWRSTTTSADHPELLNEDPYGDGWLCVIELADPASSTRCSTPPAYRALDRGLRAGGDVADVFCNQLRAPQPAGRELLLVVRRAARPRPTTARSRIHPVDPLQDAPGPRTRSCVDLDDAARRRRRRWSCAPGRNAGHALRARPTASPASAATPTATSSSTTSPCRAATPRSSALADGGYVVRDVGSLNGTYVNRERIDEGHARATATSCRSASSGWCSSDAARRVTGVDGDRAYLSIGEVLALLQDEFPDVTISKIRFLESQGLIDPERTPSGYRKFYDADVERLRLILREQREQLPAAEGDQGPPRRGRGDRSASLRPLPPPIDGARRAGAEPRRPSRRGRAAARRRRARAGRRIAPPTGWSRPMRTSPNRPPSRRRRPRSRPTRARASCRA